MWGVSTGEVIQPYITKKIEVKFKCTQKEGGPND